MNFKLKCSDEEWCDWLNTINKLCCCQLQAKSECVKVPGDNRPHIEIKLGDIKFLALIDSGANASFISLSAWSKLSRLFPDSFQTDNCEVFSADWSDLEVHGTAELPVTFGKRKFKFVFIILHKMKHDVVFGADICNFIN